MPPKTKSRKPTKGAKPKSRNSPRRKVASKPKDDENAPAIFWINDTIVGGPFDFKETPTPRGKAIRRLFAETAQGRRGALDSLRTAVRQQGAKLAIDAAESELGSLVRYHSQSNAESWRALLPLVASDNHFYAAKASRVLITTHPDGIIAGAREVVAEIARRFDYLNLADQSDADAKQLAAAAILRGILLLGDASLIGAVQQIAACLSKEYIVLAIADEDDGEEFNMPPNLLVIEFILSCAEKEGPASDAYVAWLVYLRLLPKVDREKPCLEIYEYPRGRIAPLISFVSYPEWVERNHSRLRDISYREAGRHEESGIAYAFEAWSSFKCTKPSKKQLAWQVMLEAAEATAFRAGKTPPLDW